MSWDIHSALVHKYLALFGCSRMSMLEEGFKHG